MPLFQAQQPLCLHAKGCHRAILASVDQRIPERFAGVLGYVHFIAKFTHKPNPYDPRGDARDIALTNPHVGKRRGAEINIRAKFGEHFARVRPGNVDPCIGRRDVGYIDIQPPLGIPFQHALIDAICTASGCGHIVVLLVKATGDTIIDDYTGLVGQQRITGSTDRLFEETKGVKAV